MTQMAEGRIFQINISDGGVPKLAVAQAFVSVNGLEGDRQIHTKVHGGPMRAVCVYSLEKILVLQEEGHPVFPGAMGENLTLAGIDWESVVPGTRLMLGEHVEIEMTRYTVPCGSLRPFFLEGRFKRVLQEANPGWSRLYAQVLQPGTIRVGDPVRWSAAS